MNEADLYHITEPNDFSNDLLVSLDKTLRCSICKDLFKSPMITPCSHSFCSLCIRESLSVASGKCPICQISITDGQLKRNTALSEVSEAYILARDMIAKHEKRSQRQSGSLLGKRKRSDTSMASYSSTPKARRSNSDDHSESSGLAGDDYEDPMEVNSPSEINGQTMVSCPVCDEIVDSEYINLHLDRDCKLGSEEIERISRKNRTAKTSSVQAKAWASVFTSNGKPSTSKGKQREGEDIPTKRLSKVNYDLKSLKQLKELLAEAGLSIDKGDMTYLRLKHERWVNLWNAEVDAKQPRSRQDLLKEMAEWERGRLKPQSTPKVDDAQSWLDDNKDQFDQLVANARSNRNRSHASSEAQKDLE